MSIFIQAVAGTRVAQGSNELTVHVNIVIGPYLHIAIGRKEVLRYSMMSLWRKGGNVAKVEIIV